MTLPTYKRTALPARLCNLERLVSTLEARALDGVVVSLRPNVFYLSSFAPPSNQSVQETSGYAVVVISRHAPDHPIIVVAEFDLAYFLSQPSWIEDVRPYATLLLPFDVPLGDTPLDRFIPMRQRQTAWAERARGHYAPSLVDGVSTALVELGLERGVVGFDDLRFSQNFEGVHCRDAYGALKYVRQVKTPAELELLRIATRLNQDAIEQTIATWSRGTTWQEMVHTYNVMATHPDRGRNGHCRERWSATVRCDSLHRSSADCDSCRKPACRPNFWAGSCAIPARWCSPMRLARTRRCT